MARCARDRRQRLTFRRGCAPRRDARCCGPRAAPSARDSVPKLYWEDFAEGSAAEYGPRLVTREEIVAFAAEFDPQPMHLDEDAARSTLLGGLAASGWHTCVLFNRLLVDGLINNAHAMGAPGVDEVKWLKPVRPGDRLVVRP